VTALAWQDKAACRDVDPDLFFPVGTEGPSLAQVAEAQAVCSLCTVSRDCLDWALSEAEQWGIWAGTTPDDRNAARLTLTRGAP
jgi:WhiB family redox-sensing transcriptional regulator